MSASRVVSLKTQVTEVEEVPRNVELGEEGGEVAASPLYGVAMLKIAMELKKTDAAPLDDLITGVLRRMQLDEAAFRSYLEANGGLLRTIARGRGY